MLSEDAKYGYLIQQGIHDASRGRVDLKVGTNNPLLHQFEAANLICSRWDDPIGSKSPVLGTAVDWSSRLRHQIQER